LNKSAVMNSIWLPKMRKIYPIKMKTSSFRQGFVPEMIFGFFIASKFSTFTLA